MGRRGYSNICRERKGLALAGALSAALVFLSCAPKTFEEKVSHALVLREGLEPSVCFKDENPAIAGWNFWGDYITQASYLTCWLSSKIEYVDDPANHYQSPQETWALRSGDCEDFAILAAAIIRCCGYNGCLVIRRGRGDGGNHVWLEAIGDLVIMMGTGCKVRDGDWTYATDPANGSPLEYEIVDSYEVPTLE